MFFYKTYSSGPDTMLAVCDKDIAGKTFENNDVTITVEKNFYCDKECGENEIEKLVKSATIVNATGNNIIAVLEKKGLLNESNVLRIEGTAHAQIIAL